MTMLYCLSLMDPIKYFYIQYKVDFEAVEKAVKRKLVGRYSNDVIKVVQACLVS
jgi:hypothetical protein